MPGPVCVPWSKREVKLWVGAPPEAKIALRAGGDPIPATVEPVQGGHRFVLTLPRGAETLDVLVETADGQGTWSLALRAPVRRARQKEARDLLGEIKGKATRLLDHVGARRLDQARETMDGMTLPAAADAESRCLVAYSRGLLAGAEGDYRTALTEIRQVVEVAERLSMGRYRWLAEQEQALLLRGLGRSREASELFERLGRQPPPTLTPCDIGDFLNNQGWTALLAREAGENVADPSPLFERALKTYEGCNRFTSETQANVLLNQALAPLQDGRLAEARGFLDRASGTEPDPPLSHTLWRLDLEARIARQEGRREEALARFGHLDQLARAAGSPEARLRAALGRARTLKDPARVLEVLREAEALLDHQSLQIRIDQGRETFIADRQALVGLHLQTLLDQGRNREALEVARRARSRVLGQLARAGRLESLSPDRRSRWDVLLAEYQERRAALEEQARDDWTLSADQFQLAQAARQGESESVRQLLDQAFQILGDAGGRSPEVPLAPPRPGDLILAYHPLPGGWAGFAWDGETVQATRFDLPAHALTQPGELSRRLLTPFRNRIERAKRLRILPTGTLETVDFQALPFGGDVLLAGRPVVYGLDLPPADPIRPPGRRALLVADPKGDLPGSLAEVREVARTLKPAWTLAELKGEEATANAVRNQLVNADLLHYAGHGDFAGLGGWESGLPLAGETRLKLGDFLVLKQVPAWVVLSGCDTGKVSADIPLQGLGLAHAFLLAGSRSVIASTRLADDRQVPWFFAELYRQWGREPDLAVALQRAELAWRRKSPGADWSGFRLFEP